MDNALSTLLRAWYRAEGAVKPGMIRAPIPAPLPSGFVPARQSPLLALALMVAASALVAGSTLLAKALGTGALGPALHPLQISFGRFVFALLALVPVLLWLRPRLGPVHARLHLGRTALGWAGVSLMFAAAAFIPLSDATAISFLNPVFAMVFAILFLGERVGPWRWAAAALAFTGALILLRPGDGSVHFGALFALGAALALGLEITLIKRLSGREAPLQILAVNNLLGTAIAAVAVLFVWQSLTALQWFAMAGVGVLMVSAQAAYVNALARAEASFVVPFSYATLVFAALYDAAAFGVLPDAVSLAGGAVIVAAGLVLAWREGRRPQALSR